MGAKYLSEMTEKELVEQYQYPVEYKPNDWPTYPGDPMGDDPNEFGEVKDRAGNWIITGQNGMCKLVALALNNLAEKHGIDTSEKPTPKKGKKKHG